MQKIETIVGGKCLGIISSHPDDHLIHGHAIHAATESDDAIHAAAESSHAIHELTLTLGRLSTVNFRAPADDSFVADGGRQSEGEHAAKELGITSNTHLDLPDGQLHLADNLNTAVAAIREWVTSHKIDILLTLGTLADHTDHQAATLAARLALRSLTGRRKAATGLLELETAGQGTVLASASYQSIHTIYRAAAFHASQFQVSTAAQPGWQPTTTGLWLHPHTAEGLAAYPISRAATYRFTRPAYGKTH